MPNSASNPDCSSQLQTAQQIAGRVGRMVASGQSESDTLDHRSQFPNQKVGLLSPYGHTMFTEQAKTRKVFGNYLWLHKSQ